MKMLDIIEQLILGFSLKKINKYFKSKIDSILIMIKSIIIYNYIRL